MEFSQINSMTVEELWHHLYITKNTILTNFERYHKFCAGKIKSHDSEQKKAEVPTYYLNQVDFSAKY